MKILSNFIKVNEHILDFIDVIKFLYKTSTLFVLHIGLTSVTNRDQYTSFGFTLTTNRKD